MEQPTQAEALRLAEALDHSTSPWNGERVMFAEAAAELRRLHAELESLRGSQQAAPAGDAKDAARYRYLRDGDWREREELEPVIRLQLNTLWDAKIDAAIASQQP